MAKKITDKYNDSCIKLFEFIKKLYKGKVDFKWVINHLSDGNYDGTSNTHVTLNKYLNAMKIFGIKIKKEHGEYSMLSSLYKIKLDKNDLKSIKRLKESADLLPKGKNKSNLEEFFRDIEIRYDETAQSLRQIEGNTQNLHLSFYHSEMVEQVKQCEKFCQDNQKLEIIFTPEKGDDINLLCSPLELIYLKRRICLKVLGGSGNRIYEIPVESIKSIKQLPATSSTVSIPTTVVYKIKNRLARNYKLRDWERLDKIEADGSHIIVNKNEDLEQFLKRVMRYGTDCEICSPKFLREEMIEKINETLENYK